MPKLIDTTGSLIDNAWTLLAKDVELEAALSSEGTRLIVPLRLWREHKAALLGSGKRIAVWLDSDEKAEAIAGDLAQLELVALNFPAFTDGRSYSTAVNLRQARNYKGEIRAIGDVLRDHLFYMRRCGFNTFDLKDSVKLEDARKALKDFNDNYQSTIEQPLPLFRRRGAVQ